MVSNEDIAEAVDDLFTTLRSAEEITPEMIQLISKFLAHHHHGTVSVVIFRLFQILSRVLLILEFKVSVTSFYGLQRMSEMLTCHFAMYLRTRRSFFLCSFVVFLYLVLLSS